MVEIEDKRNYSILAAMMSINNVFAVHTVDIDEDEEADRPRKSRRWTMHAISSKMNIEPSKTELWIKNLYQVYFRWLENSVIEIEKAASLSLIFNYLNWTPNYLNEMILRF